MDAPGVRQVETGPGGTTPWAAIAGVIATVSVFALAQGLTYPLLSYGLERQGASPGLVGLSAAMTPLGIVASAPLIPALARRFGPGPTALACAGLAAVLLASIGWTQDAAAWFPLRFLLGVAINPLYVLSEVWMIALAPPERRGRLMGIYTTIVSAGFAAGPLSLVMVGSEGWPPFLLGVSGFVGCALCLAAVLPRLPNVLGGVDASMRAIFPQARFLLFAVIVAAAFETIVLSLLPVYGLARGLGEVGVSALLAVLIAGNIALQVPLGLAAERWRARAILIVCSAGAGLGCLLLPSLFGTIWAWPLVFVLGALSYGVYTMAIIELGERFSGPALIAGNAAFALMWGVGGIAGPPAAGAAMDAIGVQGLPLTLAALCFALVAAGMARRRGPKRPPLT